MYLEGFQHCSLNDLLDVKTKNLRDEGINDIFSIGCKKTKKSAGRQKIYEAVHK